MASTEGPVRAHGESMRSSVQYLLNLCSDDLPDRHSRRRPFATWMKRLANLKSSHTDSSHNATSPKRSNVAMALKGRKSSISKNNPYPLSTRADAQNAGHLAFSTPLSSQRSRHSSLSQSKRSISISHDSHPKSKAPTLATTAETTMSDAAPSGAGTSGTAAHTTGDRNSTFSSPAHSVRSMTTTLTTVQSSAAPVNNTQAPPQHSSHSAHTPGLSISGGPSYTASAVPAHLAPHSHPTTYQTATANNVLTDDASILTLASSSKRRRRNSLDTNASIRALAPASMFGGSHESLPLSILSGTIIYGDNASLRDAAGIMATTNTTSSHSNTRPPLGSERATSLISASGVSAPALASERNSYIGNPRGGDKYGDGASVRSGFLGSTGGYHHGRNDSMTGSIAYSLSKDRGDYRGGTTREKEKDRIDNASLTGDRMVTAPTSPINEDGPVGGMSMAAGLQQQPPQAQQGIAGVLVDGRSSGKGLSRRSSGWESRASVEEGVGGTALNTGGVRRSTSIHGSL